MRFRKILCPIDFSAGSRNAMLTAVRIAKAHACELIVAHAWTLSSTAVAGEILYPAELVKQIVDDNDRRLESAAEEARALGAPRVTAKMIDGEPWAMLVEYAEADPTIDLIVLGTHGRTAIARVFLGSVAEMVVRHAPCSVLVVPHECKPAPFERILCSTDFSDSSRLALSLALDLEPVASRAVTLLHVIEPPRVYAGEIGADVHTGLGASSQKLLAGWGREAIASHPATVASFVRIGRPGTQVLAMLGEDNAFDLIAVGSRGRTGFRRMLLGSVAERVVRQAGRPVLVARARR